MTVQDYEWVRDAQDALRSQRGWPGINTRPIMLWDVGAGEVSEKVEWKSGKEEWMQAFSVKGMKVAGMF